MRCSTTALPIADHLHARLGHHAPLSLVRHGLNARPEESTLVPMELRDEGTRIYVLESGDMRSIVAAASLSIDENELDIFDPGSRLFRM